VQMIRQFNSAPNMELLFVRSQLSVLPCQLAESSAAENKKRGKNESGDEKTLKMKVSCLTTASSTSRLGDR
jgi:hypothetical protein